MDKLFFGVQKLRFYRTYDYSIIENIVILAIESEKKKLTNVNHTIFMGGPLL